MPDINAVLNANLNPTQRAAAIDPAGEILTLACAGSGKSTTLGYRIAWLVAQGAVPESIVAFTFTVKAADSIKRRVAKALNATGINPTVLGAMYIGTIHSYCNNILGELDASYRQFDVLDNNRLVLYLMSRGWEADIDVEQFRAARGNPPYFKTYEKVADAWQTLNDELVRLQDVNQHDPEMARILGGLSARLHNDQYIDYSLMIRLVVDALRHGHPGALRAIASLKHLMVDEYQDVNRAQEELVRLLHEHSSTLFVVGDDDQSIYGWRGADVNYILNFRDRYPGCSQHTLSINYRSTPAIVSAADSFAALQLGANRIAKNPQAAHSHNPRDYRVLWFSTKADEADWVAAQIQNLLGTAYKEYDGSVRGLTPGDFAILMRSTRMLEADRQTPRHAAFTQALDQSGIPYTLEAGGSIFERPQVNVLRDAFELLRNGTPQRSDAAQFFQSRILPVFPQADFPRFAATLSNWGRLIHAPTTGARRRVYPQGLVHDLLHAFGIQQTDFDDEVMHDLGLFSQVMLDVESVYVSVDSTRRFRWILNFLRQSADYDTSTDELMYRPDRVMVSTVHQVKGLEFPVVFIVDVDARRFPKNRRRYEGWLPAEVIDSALQRGAYQSTYEEEVRLFYTAITRPERYLYVVGAERLPSGSRARGRSPFAQSLNHPEISDDPNEAPAGLEPCTPRRRFDETVLPTTFSQIRYYLRCPREYQFRERYGFSPPIPEMFGFGQTVHTAIAKLHERFPTQPPTADEAVETTSEVFHLKHVHRSNDPENRPGPYERAEERAMQISAGYVDTYSEDFVQRRQVEARFEIPIEQAVISGSIDLLLKEDENGDILEARVVDFKTLEGGVDPVNEEELDWTELALQVQLYARAARQVLGQNAKTGWVHLLKDNTRVNVPVSDEAIAAATANVEWAVDRIIAGDFPMRPHPNKCESCDYRKLCAQVPQQFMVALTPPAIHVPGDGETSMVKAFSQYQ